MKILFFDTETTGKANMKGLPSDKGQPRIVQLAAIQTDEKGNELNKVSFIISPEGFEIPKTAADIHGITTEIAKAYGVRLDLAFSIWKELIERSDLLVGHNIDFDLFMFKIEAAIAKAPIPVWQTFCTMKSSTNICKLDGPYGYKWPKLSEAYMFFFNEKLEGAHDALVDIEACKRIYFRLQEKLAF